MTAAARDLADYACALRFRDIPADVVELARTCVIDAVACAVFGAAFPWSRILTEQALAARASGAATLPGLDLPPLPADQTALLGGAYAHAFELDSLRKPGAGVHPGATVAIPALAVAREVGAGEEDLLRAVVAAAEVQFRIGAATLHSAESRGFHAPGITGVFGAAVAAGLLRGLAPDRLAAALGVGASLGGGLLAFAASGSGGMVKRLHLGRAAQSGVFAADLAGRGFEGPAEALEGPMGVLAAYCPRSDAARLTAGLGEVWELRRLCLKRYAAHVTAQAPIEFAREAMRDHGFAAGDVAEVELGVSEKVLSHHANRRPRDVAGAQYSVPFALAAAMVRDPEDPHAFGLAVEDPAVFALCDRVALRGAALDDKWGCEIRIRLRAGGVVEGRKSGFRGAPETPARPEDIRRKFLKLTAAALGERAAAMFKALGRDLTGS